MKKNHDIISIPASIRHETEKAYLIDDGKAGVWLPKSACEFDEGELQLPEWLAIDKGLV